MGTKTTVYNHIVFNLKTISTNSVITVIKQGFKIFGLHQKRKLEHSVRFVYSQKILLLDWIVAILCKKNPKMTS